MTKKYNKLSTHGKLQSALELSLPNPLPTHPILSRRQDYLGACIYYLVCL